MSGIVKSASLSNKRVQHVGVGLSGDETMEGYDLTQN